MLQVRRPASRCTILASLCQLLLLRSEASSATVVETTLVGPPEPNSLYPVDVVVQVTEAENVVLTELIASGGNKAERSIAQGLIVVQRVFTLNISSSVTLSIGRVGVEVVVPLEALRKNGLEEAFLVATAVDEAWSAATGSDGAVDRKAIEVFSALNLKIHNATGFAQNLRDLVEPIAFALPVNKALGVDCAFWDLELNDWSLAGFVNGGDQLQEEHLVCYTQHLTFFGAVIEGVVEAVECSQVTLLSAEAFAELGSGSWYTQWPAFLLWFTLVVLFVILTSAACVDASRENVGLWDDTHFLILDREAASRPSPMDQQTSHGVAATPPGSPGGEAGDCDCECGRAIVRPMLTVWEYTKEAIDDLFENWACGFGEFRTLLGGLVLSMSARAAKGGRIMSVLSTSMQAAMVRNAQLQAGAELGVAYADVRLVLGNDDALKGILRGGVTGSGTRSLDSVGIHVLVVGMEGDRAERRALKLRQLRNAASQQVERRLRGHSNWSSLPGMSSALFAMHQPLRGVFVSSIFISSSLRVLLLACKTFGALLVITIFFEATGEAMSVSDNPKCEGPDGVGEHIGRLIAVAVVSTLLSVLPVACLHCLHWRRFKRVPGEGCEQWVRQMRAWRNQDRLICVLGTAYVTFSVLFICLFLANMGASSLNQWAVAAAISILQDALVVPLILAIFGPLFALATLAIVSHCQSTMKGSLIHDLATSRGLVQFEGGSGSPAQCVHEVMFPACPEGPPAQGVREELEAPGLACALPTATLAVPAEELGAAESAIDCESSGVGAVPSVGETATPCPTAELSNPGDSGAGSNCSQGPVEVEEVEVIFRHAEGLPMVRVSLDRDRDSRVVWVVPSGERGVCLAEYGEFVRVRWHHLEGWVGRDNIVQLDGDLPTEFAGD